jgi:iron donor protein CyaY
MISESEFQKHCETAMTGLYKALLVASDAHDFEVDQSAGTITLEFEEPRAKFVVSPNSPVRQIWVSALTKSFKLDWDEGRQEFVLGGESSSLKQLIGNVVSKQIGETVEL